MKKCIWVEDKEDGFYMTACQGQFMFNDGSVTDNFFQYCPFCGKEIKVKKYSCFSYLFNKT